MLGPVETVDEIDSTNGELLRRAKTGAPAGMVLVADHQTAGRGRLDRRWEAPPGTSLLASVLLRPALAPADAHLLTIAAGLAAVDACNEVAGVDVGLKWPNDVVVDTGDGEVRKLAGLLAESVIEGDRLGAVVVGMGLNLRDHPGVPATGASLESLGAASVDRDEILAAWMAAYDRWLAQTGTGRLAQAYRRRCLTIGRDVVIEQLAGSCAGRAVDVDDAGRLVLEVDGERRFFTTGDVVHVRPFGRLA